MTDKGLVYFQDGEVVAESNDVKVYRMNKELFLEIGPGHTLWALETELQDYMDQLSDYPRGKCLEIGLGLGVASRYMLTFPKVKHLTTVELNEDVIKAHKQIKESDRKFQLDYNQNKHTILNADGLLYAYQTKKKYDFIFIDCYGRIDEETIPLIADMVKACSRILTPNGRMLGWVDKQTPEQYYVVFEKIFSMY